MEKPTDIEIKKAEEDFKKYMGQEKEKKVYSVNLTKENVEYIKDKLKVPFSKVVDDYVGIMSMAFKKLEEKQKQEKNKQSEEKDGDKSKEEK